MNEGSRSLATPLKPCPLCGDEDMLRVQDLEDGISRVYCLNCGAGVQTYCGKGEAVLRWNTRATPNIQDESATVGEGDYRPAWQEFVMTPYKSMASESCFRAGWHAGRKQSAPVAAAQEWVSIDSRLPQNDNIVLVLLRGEIRMGFRQTESPTHEESFQQFDYWDDPYCEGQDWGGLVTHWMPLPPPPTL